MYLENVFIIGENDDKFEIGNADDLRIERWSSFDVNTSNDGRIRGFITFSFDFKIVSRTNWAIDFDLAEKHCHEIANEQLKTYEYRAINMPNTKTRMLVYRIPRTFTIAYNWTTLISASMRANLHYLHWLLTNMGCRDIITHIVAHLFAHCQYDYSLYICAN